jgi:hypothetical protein
MTYTTYTHQHAPVDIVAWLTSVPLSPITIDTPPVIDRDDVPVYDLATLERAK